jgi:hypothetical protein
MRAFQSWGYLALAAFQHPLWHACAGVGCAVKETPASSKVTVLAKNTFLSIRLLRDVVTQRYAALLGLTSARPVNSDIPNVVALPKAI